MSYWVWYTNNRGSGAGSDLWEVQVTDDGSEWVYLENTTASTGESWVYRSFDVGGYVDKGFTFFSIATEANILGEAARTSFDTARETVAGARSPEVV